MKICTQCKIEKENTEFPIRKINKDGLYSWCKECTRQKTRKYALEHPEKIKATREKRKEKAYEHAREYKRRNKKKLDVQKKIHYFLNRDQICEKARKYHQNLTEEQKKKKKEYYRKWVKTENAKKYNISRKMVYNAIRKGILIKPNKCTLCFSEEKLEAHHPNYDKPLEVVWLCKKCHGKVHRK